MIVCTSARVSRHGPVETVLSDPSHSYNKKLLADLPDLGRTEAVAS